MTGADDVVGVDLVELRAPDSGDDPRGNADGAEQHGHGRGEVLAMAPAAVKEKIGEREPQAFARERSGSCNGWRDSGSIGPARRIGSCLCVMAPPPPAQIEVLGKLEVAVCNFFGRGVRGDAPRPGRGKETSDTLLRGHWLACRCRGYGRSGRRRRALISRKAPKRAWVQGWSATRWC